MCLKRIPRRRCRPKRPSASRTTSWSENLYAASRAFAGPASFGGPSPGRVNLREARALKRLRRPCQATFQNWHHGRPAASQDRFTALRNAMRSGPFFLDDMAPVKAKRGAIGALGAVSGGDKISVPYVQTYREREKERQRAAAKRDQESVESVRARL